MAQSRFLILLVCACLAHITSAILPQMFGPTGFMGRMGQGGGGGAAEGAAGGAPSICVKAECVNYTVIFKGLTYEHRRYPAMRVAVTQSSSRWMPTMSMFARLSSYIMGKNSANMEMNMTFPTLQPEGSSGPKKMMVILPKANQINPPEPTSGRITIEELPAMEVYAKPFETSMFGSESAEAIQQFKVELGPAVALVPNKAYVAEYNSAYSFFGRRGELLLVSRYPFGGPQPVPIGAHAVAVDMEPTEI